MEELSSAWCFVGVNSKCRVQSKWKCKSYEVCSCIVGFWARWNLKSVKCARRSVDMYEFRDVSRTGTIYSMEAHACNFMFNVLWNGKLLQERYRVVMTRCHEDESCSNLLNFLERLDERIGCAQEEIVTIIKLWEDIGGRFFPPRNSA